MQAAKRCRSSVLELSQAGCKQRSSEPKCCPARRNFLEGTRAGGIWTGWIDAPAPFFCGTVVPAIAASNPHIHFRHFVMQNQWRGRFKDFSTRVLVLGKRWPLDYN